MSDLSATAELPSPDSIGSVFSKIQTWEWIEFGGGVVLCLFCLIIVFIKREKIKARFLNNPWLEKITKLIAFVGTVGGTIAADWFEPWKQETWHKRPGDVLSGIVILSILGEMLWFYNWSSKFKEASDKDTIRQLEDINAAQELAHQIKQTELEAARNTVIKQLDGWLELTAQISTVLAMKVKRLRDLVKQPVITPPEFIKALNPEQQFYQNVYAIHEFYKKLLMQKDRNPLLRLALYRLNPEDNTLLIPFVSYDGDHRDCIHNNEREMRLVHQDGVCSVVAKCYNLTGNEDIIPIPDCANHQGFEFFRAGQRDYLKSMVAFKYHITIGTRSALVLALDCNQVNFFSAECVQETKTFLVEMMKRIEYELLTSEIETKLTL